MNKIISLTLGTNLLTLLVNVFGGVLIARVLGPHERGLITGIISWSTTIYAVSSLGMGNALIFALGSEKDKGTSYLGLFSLTSVLGGTVVGLCAAIVLPQVVFMHAHVKIWLTVFLLLTPLATITEVSLSYLQAQRRFTMYNAVRLLNPVIYLGIMAGGASIHMLTFNTVMYAQVLSGLISSLVAVISCVELVMFPMTLGRVAEFIGGPFRYGIKTHITTVISIIDAQIAPLLMSSLVSTSVLGLYAVAQSSTSVLTALGSSFVSVIFPVLSRKRQEMTTQDVLMWVNKASVVLVVAMLFFVILLPTLIPLVYGEQYRSSVIPACILSIAMLFQGITQVETSVLFALDRSLSSAKGRGVSLTLSILLISILSKQGLEGIAISLVLSSLAYMLVLSRELSVALSISPARLRLPFNEVWVSFLDDAKTIFKRSSKFNV